MNVVHEASSDANLSDAQEKATTLFLLYCFHRAVHTGMAHNSLLHDTVQ